MYLEGLGPGVIELSGQTGDAGQNREWLDVEVGSLSVPSLDDQVDVIRGSFVRGNST
jgi:hypothetical protein